MFINPSKMSGSDKVLFNKMSQNKRRISNNSENSPKKKECKYLSLNDANEFTKEEIWDDSALIEMYEQTRSLTHKSHAAPSQSTASSGATEYSWKVGDYCMAPYEEDGKYYPSKVVKIMNNKCEVIYTDYDTKATVKLIDLLRCCPKRKWNEHILQHKFQLPAKQKDNFGMPEICPPPPPHLFSQIAQADTDKEALTNMLMAWYMNGYHTGYYKGMQKGKAIAGSSKNS
ncbi:survival motor neuron protein (SMN) domain-containing protein [Ditylenchus destructor]|uniref:Survival motor neuron protein (SMN) domain-containing protein n=1 Tax=Ditylenchus destructor TaxID=166010 RepID=A0AAD4MXY7_9BILA|nr:survival motor neuron protein (SMN) domain-containing protein [Ditylenchus destructor]